MTRSQRTRLVYGAAAAAGVVVLAAAAVFGPRLAEERRAERQVALLESYCTDCHNSAELAGGVSFERLTAESFAEHPEIFEAAVAKLRGRLMPPPGNPQPDGAAVDTFVSVVEDAIDSSARVPRTGHVPIQRMTRDELARTFEDLLAVEIDPAEYLPTEIEVDGFTNIAAALSTSPAFLEQYVSLARRVAHLAVGEPKPKLASAYFPPPEEDQGRYIDGMPPGTRGGMRFEHIFPADGEYRMTITELLESGVYTRPIETEHTLVVLLDLEEVFRAKLGGPEDLAFVHREGAAARAAIMQRFADIPLKVAAGRHEITITFIERSRAASDGHVRGATAYGGFSIAGEERVPRITGGIQLTGPYGETKLSRTPSRARIFVCEPEIEERERACARQIAAHLARRAFRRPVDQTDVERLMPYFESGRAETGTFDGAVEHLVAAVLTSPDFLFRAIAPPRDGESTYALDDFELASRLSFFIWGRGPDDELLALAEAGKLRDARVLEAQALRLFTDPRAETLVEDFALRWLNVDDLSAVDPDADIFPAFSDALREDFATEIDLFLRSVLLDDRDVRELITADHTFLNERLAKHYGISGVVGPQFRRVTLADERRHGILGKAAVLLRTSYGDRTSPVLRGAWVLERLVGTPPTPPPPGVETDLSTPEGEKPKTIRARLERHREDPSCNGCHGVIDPWGLALENFTVIGEWRDVDQDAEAPIDARTVLPGGREVDGPIELRAALLERSDQFVQALTQKLFMYALGRELEYHDMPQVREIVREAAREDYRFSAIVEGIVRSEAFRMQAVPHADEAQRVAAAGMPQGAK